MSNYDDEFWGDYDEFDSQIEEYKDALRNSVKDEIKEKITSLESEVAELREFREQKDKIEKEYHEAIISAKREVKEAEEKWKRARLYELLPYGEWIYDSNTNEPRCSECGEDAIDGVVTPYCPKCGAKMDEED